ncbi:unnamed protein product [Caenorhabditis angaria]|uniref:ZP domain-containing protein n=1 Tax=Caenorhabditis angaria TaxID=860376 RepID=A0A9P1N544_9PELO|nr:unnamed protein product [Caenorhabditis angaria]
MSERSVVILFLQDFSKDLVFVGISCSSTQETLHWIRTEEYSIDETKDIIVESSEAQQCSQLCQNNKIGEENFPCRAFAYSNSKQECHLSADSGYIGHKADKNKKFDLTALSSGEYFEKFCLKTNLQCGEASFELLANRMMISNYKTLTALSPHQCLAQCMKDGARCASVTYFYLDDQCQLSDVSQFSKPDQFVTANFTDYYDKICDPAEPANFVVVEPIEPPPIVENSVELERNVAKGAINYEISTSTLSPKIEENKDLEAIQSIHKDIFDNKKELTSEVEGTVIDDAEDFNENSANPAQKIKARLSTECRMSGISVSIHFEQPTSGTLYIKDHYSSCRQRFENENFAELHIPFPNEEESNPRCGGTQIEPAKWEFTAVVERNSLESPSIVTSSDKSFQITCDYSKILDKQQLADLAPKYEGDQKSARILMEIVRNGRAVSTVPLGEEIELKWTVIEQENDENLGFFINECIAERVGGAAPHPEPLKIIYQGCPEEKVRNRLLSDPIIKSNNIYSTKMKVFRFDGSRRVRIKCSIDIFDTTKNSFF